MSDRYPMSKDQLAQIDCRNTACEFHKNGTCTNISPALTLSPVNGVPKGGWMHVTCWTFKMKASIPETEVIGEITAMGAIVPSIGEEILLVKIPHSKYQEWFSMMYDHVQKRTEIPVRQQVVRELLLEWVQQNYPGYGIIAFEDLSLDEAVKASRILNRTMSYGMYVLLQKGAEGVQFVNLIDKLLTEGKNIKDANF